MDKALKLVLMMACCLPLGAQIGVNSAILSSGSAANAWAHVHSITVDHTKLASTDVTNFPVYFGGTFTWLKASGSGGDIQHSTTCCANTETVPADLIFTSDVGCTTMLNWDIPTWVSTTGVIEAYVQVPTVSHTVDTTIYACTGNPAVSTYQATYTSTWDSNYKGVWHFGDGTTLDLHDSTTNTNTCTGVNTPTTTTPLLLTGGAIAMATASTQSLDCGAGASLNITTLFTGEALAHPTSLPGPSNFPAILSNVGTGTSGYSMYLHASGGGVSNDFIAQGDNAGTTQQTPASGGTAQTANVTYVYAMRYTGGTTNLLDRWLNGVRCLIFCQNTYAGAIGSSSNHFGIGNRVGSTIPWDGSLDEVRISNIDRSDSYFAAEFNNFNAPGSFFTVVSIR